MKTFANHTLNLNRILSTICFLLGSAFAAPAVWLCIRGNLPAIPIGDTVFVPIEGVSIDGVPVGRWAFPAIVAGIFVTAIVLYFAGWRAGRRRKHESAS